MKRMCFVILLLLAGGLNASETFPLPDGSKWVFHLEWKRVLQSDLGPILMQYAANPECAARLSHVQDTFGVNLLTDIKSLSFFGPDGNEDSAVCAVAGVFDANRLQALTRLAGAHQEEQYSNRTIHQWKDPARRRPSMGCVIDNKLLLLANTSAALKRCIDTVDGKVTQSNLADDINNNSAILCFSAVSDLRGLNGTDPKAALLQQVAALKLRVESQPDQFTLGVDGKADSEEAAKNVKSIVEGIRALALLNAKHDPHGARIAEKISVENQGPSVRLSLVVPSQAVISWLSDRVKETSAVPAPVIPAVPRDKN